MGTAVFVGALLMALLLERYQQSLSERETSAWWASNGRDLINAFVLALVAVGLRLLGLPGPLALFWAAALVLWLLLSEALGARYRGVSTVLSVAGASALGVGALAFQGALTRWAQAVLGWFD